MIIQHNLQALNSHRRMSSAKNAMGKDIEKLSSGLRINRAGDDAAGLAISEKMRGQIRGLEQASRNSQDGISLLQTAEGALNEVHSILQRVRELSVQSGNDTNTADDRTAITEEISKLTDEVNSISKNTEFNTMKLLDGSIAPGAGGLAGGSLSVSSKAKFIGWLNGSWLNDAGTKIENATGWKLKPGANITVKFESLGAGTVASMGGSYLGSNLTLRINTDYLDDSLVYHGTDGPTAGGIPVDRLITHEMTHGFMFNNVSSTARPDGWFIEGLAEAVHGASDIRYSLYERGITNDFGAINDSIQSFAFAPSDLSAPVYKVGYLAASYAYTTINNNPGTGSFKDMMAEIHETDETFSQLMTKYTGVTNIITQFKADAQAAKDAGTFSDFLKNKCGINLEDGLADPIGSPDADSSGVVPNSGHEIDVSSATSTVNIGTSSVAINWPAEGVVDAASIPASGVVLQIGANKGQAMAITIDDMSATALGIDVLSVKDHADSDSAITICDNAIKKVSTQRTKLGAMQNRLEHTIENLKNNAENTTAAESRIRDVDMASTMSQYSKNNILQQAAQAMLAQANSRPQQVLQLLQ